MAHTPESAHFYNRRGEACYEVPDSTGKRMITPTLVHARKLGLLPGFTAVNKILAAPGLEKWKRDQAVLAALTLTRGAQESDEAFLKRVDTDGKAHARQRADEGTEIHKAIEQFLRGEAYDVRWHAQVSATIKLLGELPEGIVGDYKSKEVLGDKQDRELFFDDHIMQLVAYKYGYLHDGSGCPQDFYRLPTGKCVSELTFGCPLGYGGRIDVFRKASSGAGMSNVCVSILISVKEPGLVRYKIWTEEEELRGWEMFKSALLLWKLKNRYDSGWAA